jgi:ribosomal-protein-alanine N-acetyltransferase
VLVAPSVDHETEFLTGVRRSRRLHQPWVSPPADPAAFAAYLDRIRRSQQFGFLIRTVADDRLVGVINVSEVVLGAFRSGYLGYYAFARPASAIPGTGEREGLMTEGLDAVVDHMFGSVGLHRLEANIQPGNEPSRRLVQRCGFRLEGFSPRYLFVDGEWRDHERWAVTVEDRP